MLYHGVFLTVHNKRKMWIHVRVDCFLSFSPHTLLVSAHQRFHRAGVLLLTAHFYYCDKFRQDTMANVKLWNLGIAGQPFNFQYYFRMYAVCSTLISIELSLFVKALVLWMLRAKSLQALNCFFAVGGILEFKMAAIPFELSCTFVRPCDHLGHARDSMPLRWLWWCNIRVITKI